MRLFNSGISFKEADNRNKSFESWMRDMPPEAIAVLQNAGIEDEKKKYGTIDEAIFNHLVVKKSNLYLVGTMVHPSFGQSWAVKNGLVSADNEEAREQHAGRGGEGHECAVLVRDRQVSYGNHILIYNHRRLTSA